MVRVRLREIKTTRWLVKDSGRGHVVSRGLWESRSPSIPSIQQDHSFPVVYYRGNNMWIVFSIYCSKITEYLHCRKQTNFMFFVPLELAAQTAAAYC